MARILVFLAVIGILLGAFPSATADLDDQLDRQLRGAWAILEIEVYSSCSGTYSDNRIGTAGVASKADRRFDAGELVKIDKVKVKRSRVDLLTSLATPVLVARQDGPFELFDERECKAQLIFELPREVIKTGDSDTVLAAIGSALTVFPSQSAAMDSAGWNGRERQSYPQDYEQTLVRYEIWNAEQINVAVSASLERASDEAADAADDIDRDPDYLDGFAAGTDEKRSLSISDCNQLIGASLSTWKERPPSDKNKAWKRGFNDGQRLVFHLYLLQKLRHCYVPVPAAPLP